MNMTHVSLMNPGTVPIPNNTVFWFEFLFNGDLLASHLNDPIADPVWNELLEKFIVQSAEPLSHNMEKFKPEDRMKYVIHSSRNLSLKVLAQKIFGFHNYNLDIIEPKIPIQLQFLLMRDLLYLMDCKSNVSANLVSPSAHNSIDFSQLSDGQIFAASIFHRWVLRNIVNAPLINKRLLVNASNFIEYIEEISAKLMAYSQDSESVLIKIASLKKENIVCPNFHTFIPQTEKKEWSYNEDVGCVVPFKKFACQIFYTLGLYKLYREANTEAKSYFCKCIELYAELSSGEPQNKTDSEYCSINEAKLKGLCLASGATINESPSLLLRFYNSLQNNYENILEILEEDNVACELPLSFRDSAELDIECFIEAKALTASRDLCFQIQTSNAIRRSSADAIYFSIHYYVIKLKKKERGCEILLKMIKPMLTKSEEHRTVAQIFLKDLLESCDAATSRELLGYDEISSLFTAQEIETFESFHKPFKDHDEILKEFAEKIEKAKKEPKMKLSKNKMERELIHSFDGERIRFLVSEYHKQNLTTPLSSINKNWSVPDPLGRMINTVISDAFIQKFTFVTLAKAIQLVELQRFEEADLLMSLAEAEVKKISNGESNMVVIEQYISYERTYLKMLQLEKNWPTKHLDSQPLATRCLEYVRGVQSGEIKILPRVEIMEQCIVTLVNLNHLDFFTTLTVQHKMVFMDLVVWMAITKSELLKYKCTKKLPSNLFDFLVRICQNECSGRTDSNLPPFHVIMRFMCKLRECMALSMLTAVLVKIRNVATAAENKGDIFFPYIHLLPNMLPPDIYPPFNGMRVVEMALLEISNVALKYHSHNETWLRLLGDHHFLQNHYSTALKYYMEMIIATTNYFSKPNIRQIADDCVIKRMIQCCTTLKCYTQAAVLCQFLDEVDYETAFKCLSESNTSDAMDAYYDCIWDMTILEYLANMHGKRGETCRQQQVVDIIGLLELNTSNFADIKREAANSRKNKFLRAMAKQYIAPFPTKLL